MLRREKKDRGSTEINAGSMADIAFLLLIFFLVTTTIDSEKGIPVTLPPWQTEKSNTKTEVNKRNLYSVLVNMNNQLLVRGEPTDIRGLRENAKRFIMNPEKAANLSDSPDKAYIQLKHDRGTEYETYVQVYNELKAAYDELWNDAAKARFNKPFKDLAKEQRKAIMTKIPLKLSEAEPVDIKGGKK